MLPTMALVIIELKTTVHAISAANVICDGDDEDELEVVVVVVGNVVVVASSPKNCLVVSFMLLRLHCTAKIKVMGD